MGQQLSELGCMRRVSDDAGAPLRACLPLAAVELRECTQLEVLSLENNRLAAPVVDFSHATGLRSLQAR